MSTTTKKSCLSSTSPNISRVTLRWTGCSRIADTFSHFARSWHHKSCCWLRFGCCSNKSANSHFSPDPFNCRVLRSCLVSQCSYLPYWPRYQRHLANCDWMPASYTSGQPSRSRWHPPCWGSSQWSHTVSSTPCHGAWTSVPLSTHPSIECQNTVPEIETPIRTHRTTTHLSGDNNNIRVV